MRYSTPYAIFVTLVAGWFACELRADSPPTENPAAPVVRLTLMMDGRPLSERWHRVRIADFGCNPVRYLVLPPSKALPYLENARKRNPRWKAELRYNIETYRGNGEWVKVYHVISE